MDSDEKIDAGWENRYHVPNEEGKKNDSLNDIIPAVHRQKRRPASVPALLVAA
ncbi:hypothetical protein GCM10009000_053990 [Halobacterium noricense]|uniref:Uncharacterized protein n=1 Tax=Haladaptatus pallidirubidus TaxID=1008152 RepID=A0AAV3UN96_9EURY